MTFAFSPGKGRKESRNGLAADLEDRSSAADRIAERLRQTEADLVTDAQRYGVQRHSTCIRRSEKDTRNVYFQAEQIFASLMVLTLAWLQADR